MGVYHFSPSTPLSTIEPKTKPKLPSSPPAIQPPPLSKPRPKPPPSMTHKPSPYQWQAVPRRKTYTRGVHPLAPHIPAYTRDVNGNKVRGTGNTFSKGDVGELAE
jgi:hypothetical protein